MRSNTVKGIALVGLIAGATVASIMLLAPISYGQVQVRIGNMLSLLPWYVGPWGVLGQSIGIFIANLLGPFGIVDAMFGLVNTLTTGWLILRSRSLKVAAIWPVVWSSWIVGIMLNMLVDLPFVATTCYVAAGQSITMVLALIFWPWLDRRINLRQYRI